MIYPLKGVIQPYAWGGFDYIPQLLGADNPPREPQAELWMGDHPRGPSLVKTNEHWQALPELIRRQPMQILGRSVADRFGERLPFLFKILDVRKMLSIQAHPTKQAAEAGFRQENEAAIPLDAPHRNYKDNNHKPEVMVALSDFWLLHGFRTALDIQKVLQEITAFRELSVVFGQKDLRHLYQHIMQMPQTDVDRILNPLYRKLKPLMVSGALSKDQPDYWAAQAFEDYSHDGHYDRGVFSIYLLNLVHLREGEGIFQDAGLPHAYLEGVNAELMANSDNVFRGGLTPKHVDVPELMEHLVFEAVTPRILRGEPVSSTETSYPTPAPDFELSRIAVTPGKPFVVQKNYGPAIFIVLEGAATIKSPGGERAFQKGDSFLVTHGAGFEIGSASAALLFRAGVPEGEAGG